MRQAPGEESEQALVALCASGDASAWRRFHERFEPAVVRAAARALTKFGVDDPQDLAQDVAADVFTHLLANDRAALTSFQGRSAVATWLRVIARRRAGHVLRRRRPGSLDEPMHVAARGPSPSEEARVNEREAIVREQLEALAPRDRLALQLFYEGGQSYQQVADAMGLPPERIGTLLARARKRLAKTIGVRLED